MSAKLYDTSASAMAEISAEHSSVIFRAPTEPTYLLYSWPNLSFLHICCTLDGGHSGYFRQRSAFELPAARPILSFPTPSSGQATPHSICLDHADECGGSLETMRPLLHASPGPNVLRVVNL